MRTTISIPAELYQAADLMAKRLGLSRSELYRRALAKYLESHGDLAVTERLNAVHDGEDSGVVDPVLDALQRASMVRETW
jgi:metal-responsive CopG/Arc/MetJ family transcriptional regulator